MASVLNEKFFTDEAAGRKHLHCYLAEFDFRYNHRIANGIDDTARTAAMVKAAAGKRLTYRRTSRLA